RIVASSNEALKAKLIPELRSGERFATIGISQLTTSHRHLDGPILRADETDTGYKLHGFSPWVTGAKHADTLVMGATLHDGREILVAPPADLPGVRTEAPAHLLALNGSATGPVRLNDVKITEDLVLAGPVHGVMAGPAGGTGGLQTSALAIGLTTAAI